MLVVEGERIKGFAEYRYTFYKTRYLPDGRMTSLKVYVENQSIKRVLHRVASFYYSLKNKTGLKKARFSMKQSVEVVEIKGKPVEVIVTELNEPNYEKWREQF